MKAFNRLVALVAATSVTVFVVSLVIVITTDGSDELSAELCMYSLVLSFVSLVAYQPGGQNGKA